MGGGGEGSPLCEEQEAGKDQRDEKDGKDNWVGLAECTGFCAWLGRNIYMAKRPGCRRKRAGDYGLRDKENSQEVNGESNYE